MGHTWRQNQAIIRLDMSKQVSSHSYYNDLGAKVTQEAELIVFTRISQLWQEVGNVLEITEDLDWSLQEIKRRKMVKSCKTLQCSSVSWGGKTTYRKDSRRVEESSSALMTNRQLVRPHSHNALGGQCFRGVQRLSQNTRDLLQNRGWGEGGSSFIKDNS